MSDFYTDHPFADVVLKVPGADKFCERGDIVAGMKSGLGRVEKFVDGGILVNPMKAQDFVSGDILVSPRGNTEIAEVIDHV